MVVRIFDLVNFYPAQEPLRPDDALQLPSLPNRVWRVVVGLNIVLTFLRCRDIVLLSILPYPAL